MKWFKAFRQNQALAHNLCQNQGQAQNKDQGQSVNQDQDPNQDGPTPAANSGNGLDVLIITTIGK